MRVVVQRVVEAWVDVPGGATADQGSTTPAVGWAQHARIGRGLVLLAGFEGRETPGDLAWVADKVAALRVFASAGEFDVSIADVGGEVLVVSQFTLLADVRRGRRPDFVRAAPAAVARPLYEAFVEALASRCPIVRQGVFGAPMRVGLVNDGPVTLLIERP